jgi:hypothetical protein
MKNTSKPELRKTLTIASIIVAPFFFSLLAEDETPIEISGVYPHLRMWNNAGECGTGAVVPWQGDLWAITYSPHSPSGSSDKLYRFTPSLEQHIFEGSVGGTPANRMIHRESNQLLIGPYLIDGEKNIRTIPPSRMFGRLTGNARHLFEPERMIYYATMEEGLYEVDVNTLEVKCLIRDGNNGAPPFGIESQLPGYHGKGLYSSQGRLVYANNGERAPQVRVDPTVTSGALAEWFGDGDWQLVRRNQFTEVTGPGGIWGNENPESDPLWSMGWDAKSLIFALLDGGQWHYYRLPKSSHSYDGAHGWNTEWPRIREIGEKDLLATMHGAFWRFPSTFSRRNSAGIAPRSNYLKVIGDFCRWNDRIVFGCDDSAKSEFINTRPFKAEKGSPLQSNSNLWFLAPEGLDDLGPAIGRGSVWLREDIDAKTTSDPYLFSGFDYRQLHLVHGSPEPIAFAIEVDREGTDQWEEIERITVPSGQAVSRIFGEEEGVWIRLIADNAARGVTANFQYRNRDERDAENHSMFAGIAEAGQSAASVGLMRSLAYDRLGLVTSIGEEERSFAYYEINEKLELLPVEDERSAVDLVNAVRQPENAVLEDAASVILIEDGKRYRLPKNERYRQDSPAMDAGTGSEPGKTLADYMDQNLAKGAEIAVSSVHQGYAAGNAVDGILDDEEARWVSVGGESAWIEIDLGTEREIRSVWVVSGWKQETRYVAGNFDVQVKAKDGWKTVPGGEVRGNGEIEAEIRFEEPVAARHLRVASVDPGHFRIYEIAVFDRVLDVNRAEFRGFGPARVCREVATERDLLNVHGTFYELPARNAQGLAKVRPIATHNLAIRDFCSHNGLLFFTGIDAGTGNDRILRSADGKAAVWAGVIDDLWKLGKPRGMGGPWKDSAVKAGEPSDPYLMTAYDKKTVTLSAAADATIALEVDIDGTELWVPYRSFPLKGGEPLEHSFPEGFSAYWVRAVSDADVVATVQFSYR